GLAVLTGRLEDRRPLRHADGAAVDRERDHLGHGYATPTGCWMRARYSSLNFSTEECTGAATESESTQIVVPTICRVTSIRVSISSGTAVPSSKRRMICAAQAEPSRQGVHCPHDSCA